MSFMAKNLPDAEFFFTLNGFQDGERDVYAIGVGGEQLADGWYYTDEASDIYPDAYGPYATKDDAVEAAKLGYVLAALEATVADAASGVAYAKAGNYGSAVDTLRGIVARLATVK